MMDGTRVMKAAGVASTAAPYVRRLMKDEQLREELRNLIRSATHLYQELSKDDTLDRLLKDDSIIKDVDRMLESMQKAGRRAMAPQRGVNWLAIAIVGGVAGGIAALLLYPRTRHGIQGGIQGAYTTVRRGSLHAVEDVTETAEGQAA
jgi:hypothetical protein